MHRQSCRWKTIYETLQDKETSKMTVLKREEQLTPKVCLTIYIKACLKMDAYVHASYNWAALAEC